MAGLTKNQRMHIVAAYFMEAATLAAGTPTPPEGNIRDLGRLALLSASREQLYYYVTGCVASGRLIREQGWTDIPYIPSVSLLAQETTALLDETADETQAEALVTDAAKRFDEALARAKALIEDDAQWRQIVARVKALLTPLKQTPPNRAQRRHPTHD